MLPLRLRANIVGLPTYMPKNTLEADAGDAANKCETTLEGSLGMKADGVGTAAAVRKVLEASVIVPAVCPGASTHKCDPPMATPKQMSWKKPRPLALTLWALRTHKCGPLTSRRGKKARKPVLDYAAGVSMTAMSCHR